MKVALKPNAELDLLTRDELREELEAIVARLRERPALVRGDEEGQTDASGNIGALEFYRVPPGMMFHLTRCHVLMQGVTPATPFTGAGAFLELLRNAVAVDWESLAAGSAGLPSKLVDADSPQTAPVGTNGDVFAVRVQAVTATRQILVRFQGLLEPVVLGN